PGQHYAWGLTTPGEYYWARSHDPEGRKSVVVRGGRRYHQIQLGHRVAFVKAGDVGVVPAGASTPDGRRVCCPGDL
ncbi:hypothetical protein, partial [Streptomyces sp. JJ36]|uniref:hypothetical protein n=1 Tax=Streptomyces sp. JJ36 TaxID=2736645 RepID=UPI001F2A6B39